MVRRRRKLEAELVELVRSELANLRAEVQTALSETAAVLSVRVRTEIEQRVGEPSALAYGIQGVRESIAARDSELVHVLRRVGETCDAVAERVQIDRIDRSALVEAVSRLTSALAVAGNLVPSGPSPARPTVIGGTVGPMQPAPADVTAARTETIETAPPDEIDLDAAEHAPDAPPARSGRPVRPDGVEVRCRFGDRWVTGFEVCEVIRLDDATRYRLRRRSDGSVIPTLFDEKDLRFFSTAFVDQP
jgi:hypothetical protein